ncbi:MAG TPA: M56 family metallopeptidase [Puia sp.]|nr:M56 family metallopeptidase [Puia sp.]
MLPSYIRQEVMHAICWTLVHSLWLGILAAMVAGIVIICTRKLPVVVRYKLLGADLLLFVLAVGITFCYQLKQGYGAVDGLKQGRGAGSQLLAAGGMQQAAVAGAGDDQATGGHQVFRDNRTSAEGQASGYDRSSGRQASSDYWSLIDYQPLVDYLNRRAFTIVDVWLICLFIQLSRLMGGLYGIGRLRRTGTRPSDKWNDTLLLLSGQLGVKRKVSLLESALIKVPSASGFFRPVILIPLGILSNLPAEQVETILLHELAHIKRGDYVTNLLLHITEAIFFFNPGLRWLNALIRREREACCDDMVLEVTPDRTVYLSALVSFREYLTGKMNPPYAVALGKGRNSLLWRVRRMLTNENKTLDIMEKTILSFGLAAVIAVGLISMKPASAQVPPAPPIAAPPIAAPPVAAPAMVAPVVTPPATSAPVYTTTPRPAARIIKDTLPPQLRMDSIKKRKAELDEQQAKNRYVLDAMKREREEQMRRNKALMDTLSRVSRDTLQGSLDAAKLAQERASLILDRYQKESDEQAGYSDRRIQGITLTLLEAGLIPDDKTFSFSLDSERLLVNDKTAPDPIFQKLKERYLHSPRDHFNYMKHGGNTVTNISVDKD